MFDLGYVHITKSTYLLLKSDEFQFEEGPPYHLLNNGSFFERICLKKRLSFALAPIGTYFIGKRRLSHRITSKPPPMILATAAAVAVASGISLSIPLNDAKNICNDLGIPVKSRDFI
jgi:hypothetical protein